MKTTDVADVLSQSLGLPSLSGADTVHARVGSLKAPSASVLFVADGHDMDKDSMWQILPAAENVHMHLSGIAAVGHW